MGGADDPCSRGHNREGLLCRFSQKVGQATAPLQEARLVVLSVALFYTVQSFRSKDQSPEEDWQPGKPIMLFGHCRVLQDLKLLNSLPGLPQVEHTEEV